MFRIEYLIYIYISLCACMMLFNVICMIFTKSTEKNKNKSKSTIIKKINLQILLLKNNLEVSSRHRKYMYQKLKKTHNLLLFEYALDLHDQQLVEKYIKSIEKIFSELSIYYEKADGIKKAYFVYIVKKYKISGIQNTILYKFLEEESIYCRDNTLKAIISSENVENIITALKIINKQEYYYYPDTINKALLEFAGNISNFAKELWENYHIFDEKIQIAIIRYINQFNLDYKQEFYELAIKDTTSKNVKIEIIKYFRNNIYEDAKQMIINIAKLKGIENKELIVEAAKTLQKYNCLETKEVLKLLLKRNNWEIKNAASESLLALGTSYYEFAEIYNGEDEVARGILKYKIQNLRLKYKALKEEVS